MSSVYLILISRSNLDVIYRCSNTLTVISHITFIRAGPLWLNMSIQGNLLFTRFCLDAVRIELWMKRISASSPSSVLSPSLLTGSIQICPLFYACSHLRASQSCKSILSTIFFNKFHIKIADDTIQHLKNIVSQNRIKYLRLFRKLTYNFVAIYIWCSSINSSFHFYIWKETTNIW